MTTFTLTDLACRGNCDQGRLPCDCVNTITVDAAGATFSYTAPSMPCVIVDSGASVSEPIPFLGWAIPSSENL